MKSKQFFFILVILLLLSIPMMVSAHGVGAVQRLNIVPAGPYQISMWTDPEPLAVGTVHFSVAVSTPPDGDLTEAGPPVFDATVQIILTPVDGGDSITVATSHKGAVSKIFYDGDAKIPTSGDWRITVIADGTEGHGETETIVTVEKEAGGPIWLWIGAGAIAVLVAGFFIFNAFKSDDKNA